MDLVHTTVMCLIARDKITDEIVDNIKVDMDSVIDTSINNIHMYIVTVLPVSPFYH
jgi:hypothetical protein